jgi:hypothetical protein
MDGVCVGGGGEYVGARCEMAEKHTCERATSKRTNGLTFTHRTKKNPV